MNQQLEIFRADPTDPNVDWLVNLLFERRDWLTAAEIIQLAGHRLHDRAIRALAEAAAPKIISGQKGYKHTAHASPEEIHHFYSAMRSQAVKMLHRAQKVRQYAHAKIG
jgi:hypothetical protein